MNAPAREPMVTAELPFGEARALLAAIGQIDPRRLTPEAMRAVGRVERATEDAICEHLLTPATRQALGRRALRLLDEHPDTELTTLGLDQLFADSGWPQPPAA